MHQVPDLCAGEGDAVSNEGLAAVRLGIDDSMTVFETLTPEEWARPSGCLGWRVQDVAAHASSNFMVTVDPPAPPTDPTPPMPAERMMDLLVEPRRRWSPEQVLEELRSYAPRLVETLGALQQEPLASTPMTMADLGTYQMHQLADAYAFDLYCHLRIDVLAPHGPIERDVPVADEARLAPAVGWMLAGLPQMQGEAFPMVDRSFTLRLSGPGGGLWTISGSGDGHVDVEPGDDPGAAATVTSDAHAFVLWGTKRAEWRQYAVIQGGDTEFVTRFLDTLNIV
ncbi:MAG: maleylpyruvate isomerase family mycothiol-dependent enzyme [Ilumatobacteraceae bacterium]